MSGVTEDVTMIKKYECMEGGKLIFVCIFVCLFALSCNTMSYHVGCSMSLSNFSLLRYSYVRAIDDESVYSTLGKIRSITLCPDKGEYWILTIKANEMPPYIISQISLRELTPVLNKADREKQDKLAEVKFVELSPLQIKVSGFEGDVFVYPLTGIPGIPFCGKLKGLSRGDNNVIHLNSEK